MVAVGTEGCALKILFHVATEDGARFLLSCLDLPGPMVDGYAWGEAGSRPPVAV